MNEAWKRTQGLLLMFKGCSDDALIYKAMNKAWNLSVHLSLS